MKSNETFLSCSFGIEALVSRTLAKKLIENTNNQASKKIIQQLTELIYCHDQDLSKFGRSLIINTKES